MTNSNWFIQIVRIGVAVRARSAAIWRELGAEPDYAVRYRGVSRSANGWFWLWSTQTVGELRHYLDAK